MSNDDILDLAWEIASTLQESDEIVNFIYEVLAENPATAEKMNERYGSNR